MIIAVLKLLMKFPVSSSTNALQVCGRDGHHPGNQEVGRCHTRGKSQGMCNVTRMPLLSSNKAEPTLALKPRGDVTRSPNRGISGPKKRTNVLPKNFKKKLLMK